MGFLSKVYPTKILPSLSLKSSKSFAIQRIAITSDAGVILKPSSRAIPLFDPPKPITICRRLRSFISITRFQVMVLGSMFRLYFLFCKLLSISAESRLFAFSIAAKSPVKCKLISTIGINCAYPPPAAPPLIPKTGPKLGSRNTAMVFFPILFRPSHRPTETVVFPSPAGVGLMAVTKISFAFFIFSSSMYDNGILALYFP